jgi:hypothetical protein
MSTSSPTASAAPSLIERLKPYTAPYYLTVAAVLGAISTVFVVVTVVLILIVTNFNILGWWE